MHQIPVIVEGRAESPCALLESFIYFGIMTPPEFPGRCFVCALRTKASNELLIGETPQVGRFRGLFGEPHWWPPQCGNQVRGVWHKPAYFATGRATSLIPSGLDDH